MPVQKRRDRWHYAFCIRGVRYRGALPEARTKFEAEKAETKIRQEVYEGRHGRPTGEKDFVVFVEEIYKPWAIENKRSFKSNDKYKLPVICESKCFKGKTFAQISPFLIEQYKKERREAVMESGSTRKPSTINRELGLLSKIFSLAIKYGVTDNNPCREIPWLPENNNRVRYLLDEEEPQLFAVLDGRRKHLRALIALAIGTGMRRGDQLNLRWEKVDFQRDVIYVPNSKTGKDYSVPMNADVRNTLLQLRCRANRSDYLFINPRTNKPYTDLKKAFGTACRLAGIRDLHWHDLRHTFGTRLAEAGCSEATIAELMGHSDPQTTRRYTHATDRAKRAAVEAVRVLREDICHKSATTQERLPELAAVNG
ncbi:MAG: site-specific integrase [Pyrinomonadaceae bacterium]|nr:site-specific integrase [Pyrinomonadaceae bacterium]